MLTAPETPAHRSAPLDAEAGAWKQVAESRLSTILIRDKEILDLLKDNMRLKEILAGIHSRAEEGLKK